MITLEAIYQPPVILKKTDTRFPPVEKMANLTINKEVISYNGDDIGPAIYLGLGSKPNTTGLHHNGQYIGLALNTSNKSVWNNVKIESRTEGGRMLEWFDTTNHLHDTEVSSVTLKWHAFLDFLGIKREHYRENPLKTESVNIDTDICYILINATGNKDLFHLNVITIQRVLTSFWK